MTDSNKLTRRKVVLGLCFASAAGVAFARQPKRSIDYLGKDELEKVFPKQIGQWNFATNSGLVIPAEDELSQAIYSQLLTRIYTDGENPPIMLLVAHSGSQTGILQIHRPEFCYSAGGYELSPTERHTLATPSKPLDALTLTATSDRRTEQIVYWTRVGEHLPTSWREQRLRVAMDNLRGLVPDATMVRISVMSSDRQAAHATMDKFIQAMIAEVSPALRRVLIA